MRVRDKDVTYMTSDWKSAIKAKYKATAKYLKTRHRKTGSSDEGQETRQPNKEGKRSKNIGGRS